MSEAPKEPMKPQGNKHLLATYFFINRTKLHEHEKGFEHSSQNQIYNEKFTMQSPMTHFSVCV